MGSGFEDTSLHPQYQVPSIIGKATDFILKELGLCYVTCIVMYWGSSSKGLPLSYPLSQQTRNSPSAGGTIQGHLSKICEANVLVKDAWDKG